MEKVEVTWFDAGLESMHMEIEHAKEIKPMLRKNVGYLIESNEDRLIMCFGTISDKGIMVVDQALVIPKGMVEKISRLRGK